MLYLVCGIIIGFLLNELRHKKETIINKVKIEKDDVNISQFFEPISDKEKYESAQSISDLIK